MKHKFLENFTPFNVQQKAVNLDILVELLVGETHIYAQQSGRNFLNSSAEINELPSISHDWHWNNTTGNAGIQNIFTRRTFSKYINQNILTFTLLLMILPNIQSKHGFTTHNTFK